MFKTIHLPVLCCCSMPAATDQSLSVMSHPLCRLGSMSSCGLPVSLGDCWHTLASLPAH